MFALKTHFYLRVLLINYITNFKRKVTTFLVEDWREIGKLKNLQTNANRHAIIKLKYCFL